MTQCGTANVIGVLYVYKNGKIVLQGIYPYYMKCSLIFIFYSFCLNAFCHPLS